MKQNKLFKCWLLAVILFAGSGVTWGQTITITQSSSGITTNSYDSGAERTWTQSTVGFGAKAVMKQSGQAALQFQASNGVIYNTTEMPGKITSVKVTQTGTARSCTVYGYTSRIVNSTIADYAIAGATSMGATGSTSISTINFTGANNFFAIKVPSSATYISEIVITYETSSCTSLGTPTVTATPGNGQATLSWGAVANASSYTLIWNGGSPETVTSPVTKTGLTNGTSYSYSVMAVGDGTTYCATNTAATGSVTPTAPTPPSAPTATAATSVTSSGFTANWNAVSGATGYKLDVYTKSGGGNATDLFISEYIEGSSNNKAIEIYNGTGSSVDLSGYTVYLYANGALQSAPTATLELTGTLANGDVYVIATSTSNATILALADITSAVANFNGDDAIGLWKESTSSFVDIFGQIGTDPGNSWGTSPLITVDRTLVRKSTVSGGVTTNPSSGFPTLATEWDSYNIDAVSNLGSHTFAGGGSKTYVTGYQDLSVSGTNQAVSGLSAGTTYHYVVRASNAGGTSVNSNEIEVTTTSGAAPTITVTETTVPAMSAVANSTTDSETIDISGTNLTENITVTIDGTNAAMFSVVTNPSPLTSAGGTATITYTPTAAGTHTATLRINSTGATEVTRQLNGTATGTSAGTYTWQGVDNGDWTTASNWTPTRTTPAATDILQFTDGTTKTITNVQVQTIGGLIVNNGTKVSLNSPSTSTLTVSNGVSGADLRVESGSELNIAQTSGFALTVALSAGATGSISGSMDFSSTQTAANQITSADAAGLTFNSGAIFTQNSNSTGNVFGSGTANSVIFANGSTFVQYGGSNPFQKDSPQSVVVFETGSLFKLKDAFTPAFSGRTYSNFEIDAAGASITPTGTSAVTIDNLTITNGTLNFNMTGTPGHKINGNVSVAPGAHLNFAPTDAGTVAITGNITVEAGGKLSTGTYSTVSVAGNLTIESDATGTGTLVDNGALTVSGTTTVNQAVTAPRTYYMGLPVSVSPEISGITGISKFNIDNDTWSGIATQNTTFDTKGIGYLVQVGTTGTTNISFTGTLNSGNVEVPFSKANRRFNYYGNPYPSFLETNKVITAAGGSNIDPSIWFYSKGSGSYAFTTYNNITAESLPSTADGGVIPPMQGFWLRAKTSATATSFTFTDEMRLHKPETSTAIFKAPKATAGSKLNLTISNGTVADETLVLFNEAAQTGFDVYDSEKMMNSAPSLNIFTIIGDQKLAMNGMPAVMYDTEIPLGVNVPAGTYTISAIRFANFAEGEKVQLIDKATNTLTDISATDYTFAVSEALNNTTRFVLVFPSKVGTSVNSTEMNISNVYVSDGRIVVNVTKPVQGNLIEVYNSVGQRIASQAITGSSNRIEKQLNSGVYIVKVNAESTKVIIK